MDHVLNQPMAEAESHEEAITKFPLDRNAYHILDEIGRGVSAVVYKAICVPVNLALVAIKAIDLDRGSHSTATTNLDNIRLETKTMSLLSHPNILSAHCSFTVDRRLWVVMPFMSAGSVQSIISSSFPTGLPEPCIAVVLKDTLNALSYLHDQGHIHRDIKAGNILIDSNGSVKLADFGVSASVYDKNSALGSSFFLTDVAGTPYWMAPEVIHSHNGYGLKADIWSFGITALELAHGGPPLSNLPPSKSLLLKITKRFRFSDYEKGHKTDKNYKHKKFSKAFKDMVGLCLQQDPTKRPSADKLLKHSFFKNCKLGSDFLVKNVVQELPSVEDRFKETMTKIHGGHEDREEDDEAGDLVRQRRISGWNFNEDGFDLDPVLFPFSATESTQGDSLVKMVRFGGETIFHIQDESNPSSPGQLGEEEDQVGGHSEEINVSDESIVEDRGGESLESNPSSPGEVGEEGITQLEVGGCSEMNVGKFSNYSGVDGGVDREAMVGSLVAFVMSLDDQRQNVMTMIGMLQGGEEGSNWEVPVSREEQMGQVIERMRSELESERERNFQLEMELEFLRIQISGAYNNAAAAGIH